MGSFARDLRHATRMLRNSAGFTTVAILTLAFEPSNMTRDFHRLVSFALLKEGVALPQAQAAMDVLGKRIARDFPASNEGWGVIVE